MKKLLFAMDGNLGCGNEVMTWTRVIFWDAIV